MTASLKTQDPPVRQGVSVLTLTTSNLSDLSSSTTRTARSLGLTTTATQGYSNGYGKILTASQPVLCFAYWREEAETKLLFLERSLIEFPEVMNAVNTARALVRSN